MESDPRFENEYQDKSSAWPKEVEERGNIARQMGKQKEEKKKLESEEQSEPLKRKRTQQPKKGRQEWKFTTATGNDPESVVPLNDLVCSALRLVYFFNRDTFDLTHSKLVKMIPSTIMDITNVSLTYQKNDDERIKNGAVLLASSHNLKSIAIETDAKPFIIIRHISSCQLEKIVIRTPFAQLSNSISSLIMRHVETIEELVLDNHCFGDGSSFDSSALSLIKNLTIIRLQLSPFNMFGKMIEEIPREKNPRWDIISLKVFDDEIDNFCRIYNAKLAFWRESKLFIDFILQHDITSKTFHILSNIIASSMNIARIWVSIYQR